MKNPSELYKKIFSLRFFSHLSLTVIWKLLVIATLMFFLAGIAADGYIFWRFSRSALKEELISIPKEADLDIKAFEGVYDYLKDKEERFNRTLLQKPMMQDPSH